MFKKCLIVSVILHLSLFVGFGLISDRPDNLRAAQKHSPSIIVALDSDLSSETSKERVAGNDSRSKTGIRPKQSLFKDHREQTAGLSVAEETPPAILTVSEKLNPENTATESGGYEVEAKEYPKTESSGLAEQETVGPTGNQSSPEANRPDRLPVKIHNPTPVYPLRARKNNWEGITILTVLVRADGLVGEVTIFQSSGYELLDRVAKKTVKRWRYRPALKNGVAVAWQMRVRIKFVLEG